METWIIQFLTDELILDEDGQKEKLAITKEDLKNLLRVHGKKELVDKLIAKKDELLRQKMPQTSFALPARSYRVYCAAPTATVRHRNRRHHRSCAAEDLFLTRFPSGGFYMKISIIRSNICRPPPSGSGWLRTALVYCHIVGASETKTRQPLLSGCGMIFNSPLLSRRIRIDDINAN